VAIGEGQILAKQRALGRQLAAEVRNRVLPFHDEAVTAYVNDLARRLASHCVPDIPVEAGVIASDQANGFALPGGFIFLNSGLLRFTDSEAELAGIVAHLLARVEGRRPLRRANVAGAGVPLIYMGGWNGDSFRPVHGAGLAIPPSFTGAMREAASQADERGVRCVAEAGYDPSALVNSLRKLAAEEPATTSAAAMFSTHPPAAERAAKIQAIAGTLPSADFVLSTDDFEEAKRRVEAAAQRQNDRPAPSLRR
jgi:predicted Zn-dependent protease